MNRGEVWTELSRSLRAAAPYRELVSDPAASLSGVPIPLLGWLARLLAEDLERPLAVIVPHESDVLALEQASALFGLDAVSFLAPSLTPYQPVDASLAVRAQESVALDRLARGEGRFLVSTVRSLFRRLPPPAEFSQRCFDLETDGTYRLPDLAERLSTAGYHRADLVTDVGEFAVRGGIFDLFPAGEELPVRLDFFGDTLDTLRTFDPDSQRSLDSLERLRVVPLSLLPADAVAAARLAEHLAEDLDDEPGYVAASELEELERGVGFPGWENLLPAVQAESAMLPDYLPRALWIAVAPATLEMEIADHLSHLERDHRAASDQGRLTVPPEVVEHPPERVRRVVEEAALVLDDRPLAEGCRAIDFGASPSDRFHGQLPRFPRAVETAVERRERVLLVAPPARRSRFEDLCRQYDLTVGRGGVEIVAGELTQGFRLPAAGCVLYGEEQLFHRQAPRLPKASARFGPFLSGLRDLKVGDFIVHVDHGIGQFLALRTIGGEAPRQPSVPPGEEPVATGPEVEVMEIGYADDRTLLLPLSRLDQVQKYSGIESVKPRLDKLGGTSWNRTKERVRRGMRKLAGDLLKLYAERELAEAPPFVVDSDLQAQFDAAFEFEPTDDQLEAIAAIKADLQSTRPMDRLLCGDVGFGKTEVAMRAAFKAVDSGYQVAVLAPTTILADQHLETFRSRFEGFPVEIEMVSRLRSAKELREVRRRAAAAEVDVLVGTHRLLSRDIELAKLGLLVIDEEQRFGVAQKERLKQLRRHVHVLAMSATPVPRTLQLSLAGVRDLSLIETPPRNRLAVETAVLPYGVEIVREAIDFELERQGQVFYVHNRVQGIEAVAEALREMRPGLKLTIGHGQLDEKELAQRMHAFKRGDYDLLLATTIIENGIDIPRVNTMIVERADRFGLAQLYQLRGRVGRSDLLGYCYLLVPGDRQLGTTARERLTALKEFCELGAGFRVAARDLEIRGAGNLLGAEQSGHIAAVGIETYLKMLEETVAELRGETIEETPSVALNLPVVMAIPPDYIEDANLRMGIYRKIATSEVGRSDLEAELRERFGTPPPVVLELLEVAELKRLAESLRVQSISAAGRQVQIRLRRDAAVDVDRLIRMVAEEEGVAFSPTGILTLAGVEPKAVVARTRGVLEAISP